jgi:hypothetical protein
MARVYHDSTRLARMVREDVGLDFVPRIELDRQYDLGEKAYATGANAKMDHESITVAFLGNMS